MSSDSTFGSPSGRHNSTIEYAETAVIDGVNGKKVFPIDLPPTGQTNPSIEYDYTDPSSIVIQETIGTDVYQQTITISGTVATEGEWIKL